MAANAAEEGSKESTWQRNKYGIAAILVFTIGNILLSPKPRRIIIQQVKEDSKGDNADSSSAEQESNMKQTRQEPSVLRQAQPTREGFTREEQKEFHRICAQDEVAEEESKRVYRICEKAERMFHQREFERLDAEDRQSVESY